MTNYKTTIKQFEIKANKTSFIKTKISSSKDAYNVIKQFYSDDIEVYESFFLLLLNKANNTVGYAKISQGGIAGTVVDVKIIAKYCIDSLASAAIIAHNHPSGNLKPSEADIKITRTIKETLRLFDCQLLDHLILTADSFYSFGNEGII